MTDQSLLTQLKEVQTKDASTQWEEDIEHVKPFSEQCPLPATSCASSVQQLETGPRANTGDDDDDYELDQDDIQKDPDYVPPGIKIESKRPTVPSEV